MRQPTNHLGTAEINPCKNGGGNHAKSRANTIDIIWLLSEKANHARNKKQKEKEKKEKKKKEEKKERIQRTAFMMVNNSGNAFNA
jgi:hypothetical protein